MADPKAIGQRTKRPALAGEQGASGFKRFCRRVERAKDGSSCGSGTRHRRSFESHHGGKAPSSTKDRVATPPTWNNDAFTS